MDFLQVQRQPFSEHATFTSPADGQRQVITPIKGGFPAMPVVPPALLSILEI